ncbi:MAG: PVC-type heme-binding CxxCH protein, partial [Isosphaeraceae bacterium]
MRRRVVVALGWLMGGVWVSQAAPPSPVDPGLVIQRFAAEPEIVTPVGIAVDPKGRVLVVESHTHFRPDDYDGPPADRIRILEDRDGEGQAERVGTFFEGSRYTMGLGFHPDGTLLVATRWEIFRLRDANGDGQADGPPEPLAKLETEGDYPHNGLSGFAFDAEGRVYFGLGENLGASYSLVGQDGTTLSGGGEGGNVYRMRPDGSGLERIATGFWNPFHLAFDPFGNLFAVDNDPDSRPPCRLLRVVEGGDYGYQFRNGRKGLHPFTAWNGELPGTLPMAAGTGEAPSGIVSYESDQLTDLRGALLATSWGDHRIDAFTPAAPNEANRLRLTKDRKAIVTGGEDFRPVGIAIAPDGALFVSDWVDRSYTLHRKGRVWRIAATRPPTRTKPTDDAEALRHADRSIRETAARRLAERGGPAGREALRRVVSDDPDPTHVASALDALISSAQAGDEECFRKALAHPSEGIRALAVRRLPADRIVAEEIAANDESPLVRAEGLRRITKAGALPIQLTAILGNSDPFMRQAAREGLRRSLTTPELLRLARHVIPSVRVAATLILRDLDDPSVPRAMEHALGDQDPDVRFLALRWVAESRRAWAGERLWRGLMEREFVSPREFVALLVVLDRLSGLPPDPKREIPGEEYVARFVTEAGGMMGEMMGQGVLPVALRMLRPDHPSLTDARLSTLFASGNPSLQVEVLRTWRERPGFDRFERLEQMVRDMDLHRTVRMEALVGLSKADLSDPNPRGLLVQLSGGSDLGIRREALRSLRGAPLTTADAIHLEKTATKGDPVSATLLDTLAGFDLTSPESPRSLDDWGVK